LLARGEGCLLVTGHHPQQRKIAILGPIGLVQAQLSIDPAGAAGQAVAGLQFIAVKPADFFAYHGRAATETGIDVEAAADGEVAAGALAGKSDFQPVAGGYVERLPLQNGVAIQFAWCLGAGDDATGIDFGFERQATEADFDAGGVGIVAEQAVGPVEGDEIERSAGGQPQFVGAVTAAVLQQAQSPGLLYNETAHSSPPRSRKSARSIASKRTRSPALTGMLGSRSGSNMRVGQSPIRFQPPGDTAG
jgi:hypothetical protein